MEPLLELRHVKKYFPVSGGKMLHAVDDVSFSIPKGATLGLVGESGCGKSTLGRVCIRLLEATEGEILFEGTDIRKLRRSQMHKKRADMQMIFQDPLACLNARRNVYELISEPLTLNPDYWRKLSKEEVTKRLLTLWILSVCPNGLSTPIPTSWMAGAGSGLVLPVRWLLTPNLLCVTSRSPPWTSRSRRRY